VKAAPFGYVRPATVDDAVAELADGEAKVLAGGQSLVPVLAMRLARPSALVDINSIAGLGDLDGADGRLTVGAAVRQQRLEHHPLARKVPLIALALPWVGHRELRSRGTVCGSVAHADPAAELPAVASCLNAEIEIAGPDGGRTERARDFFTGPMSTTLAAPELITRIRFPVARPGEGYGFAEVARRHGDFALAGVAVRVTAADGEVREAVLTAFGVSGQPSTRDVTALVSDGEPTAGALVGLAREVVETAGDAHGSRSYRRRMVAVLASRELGRARAAALGEPA
jgi:2-furoyl-CoA dehydrogenase FAD binding subunit